MIVANDGTAITQMGNFIVCSNGITYTFMGNTLVGPKDVISMNVTNISEAVDIVIGLHGGKKI